MRVCVCACTHACVCVCVCNITLCGHVCQRMCACVHVCMCVCVSSSQHPDPHFDTTMCVHSSLPV